MKIDSYKNYSFNKALFNQVSDNIASMDQFETISLKGLNSQPALPGSVHLINLNDASTDKLVLEPTRELIDKIQSEWDLECTVSAYYPKEGFIDWHTNENIERWNAICTWSQKAKSWFEYQLDDETIRVNDFQGWSVKRTYWGQSKPIPHRASSDDNRITFTFSSKDQDKVDRFINWLTKT